MNPVEEVVKKIREVDLSWQEKAQVYMDSLAMPPGALGMLNKVALKMATIQQTLQPNIHGKSLLMACADHGITDEGVSAYPQITNAIVNTALAGGAAINAFCDQAGVDLTVLDVGVKGEVVPSEKLVSNIHHVSKRIAPGTANMLYEAAMTVEECSQAIMVGAKFVSELDANVLVLGEMGIGNTTSASCLLAKFCGLSAEKVTGPGTGVKGEVLKHKKDVVTKILDRCAKVEEPFDILRQMGGLEIAALTGAILGAVSQQKVVVLDGFISGAAALAAQAMAPFSQQYMFAAHLSSEPGHRLMLENLQLEPLMQLDLHLGEGTGAVLATNLLEVACQFLSSMMSLEDALKNSPT